MENATKALILAGEVLIGLIVISLIVYAVSIFGNFSADMNEKMSEKTIVTFNQHYWEYQGRIDITAEEIASIINFSKESNDKYELAYQDSSVYWVDVYIDGNKVFDNTEILRMDSTAYNNRTTFNERIRDFIQKNNTSYYYCSIDAGTLKIDDNTIKVKMENNDDLGTNSQTKMINKICFHKLNRINGVEFDLKKHTLDEYNIEIS